MISRIMGLLGNVAKHILGSLERGIKAMALTGIIVALIVGLGTEAIGAFYSQQFPPSGLTHLAAAALMISFGYAAAMTVAIIELLRGFIRGIELIVAESEHLAQEGARELEGVAQRVEGDALRLGRAAIGDVEGLGRGVLGGASALEHGVADRVHGVEQGVAARLPGHRADATLPAMIPTTSPHPGQTSR